MVLQGYQAEIPAKKLKRGHKKKFLAEFWLILPKIGCNSGGIPPNSVTYNSMKFRWISRNSVTFFMYVIPYISKEAQIKISGRILADFYQKQAEKGPQKICILYIKNQIYHSYHS